MAVLVENTSALGRRVKVSVPDATVKEQVKAKMAKLGREVRLKGFRPGKVPYNVLQQRFGESVRMEVINDLIRDTLGNAVKDNALQPAGTPKIEEIKDDQDLEYTASFEVYPEIVLADIADVVVDKRQVEITDTDVTNMVTKLCDQLADFTPVERAVQTDDKITVDFSRLLAEEGASKQEQQNVQMIVGSEGVLPGLSEVLTGKEKGALVETSLRYPADWAESAVAGKEVTLWVTVKTIEQKNKLSPAELATKLGVDEQDSEKLNTIVRERMQSELEEALQDELKESVLEKLLEKNPLELPSSLVDQEKEAIRREVSRSRRMEIPKEALDSEEVETQARRRVELGLLLNEVIKKHNLKADGKRVRAEIEKIALRFAKPAEVVEAYYKSNELLYGVERMVLLDQAVQAILQEVKLNEKSASFDEVMNPVDQKNKD